PAPQRVSVRRLGRAPRPGASPSRRALTCSGAGAFGPMLEDAAGRLGASSPGERLEGEPEAGQVLAQPIGVVDAALLGARGREKGAAGVRERAGAAADADHLG